MCIRKYEMNVWIIVSIAICKVFGYQNEMVYQSTDINILFSLQLEWKGGFQSHFSHHSVTIQSTEWQAHFSDSQLIFLKNYAQRDSNPG